VMNARRRGTATIAMERRFSREEKRAAALIVYPDVERPRTRGDCLAMPRPCPFVSCAYHLYLDVNEDGAIKLNFPHLDPEHLTESCALDVADRGGVVLEEVGALLDITRERVRQIELSGMAKARAAAADLQLAMPADHPPGNWEHVA
jgi:hypothetical protein